MNREGRLADGPQSDRAEFLAAARRAGANEALLGRFERLMAVPGAQVHVAQAGGSQQVDCSLSAGWFNIHPDGTLEMDSDKAMDSEFSEKGRGLEVFLAQLVREVPGFDDLRKADLPFGVCLDIRVGTLGEPAFEKFLENLSPG